MIKLTNIELSKVGGGCLPLHRGYDLTHQSMCTYENRPWYDPRSNKLIDGASDCGCPKIEPERVYSIYGCTLMVSEDSRTYVCNHTPPSEVGKI